MDIAEEKKDVKRCEAFAFKYSFRLSVRLIVRSFVRTSVRCVRGVCHKVLRHSFSSGLYLSNYFFLFRGSLLIRKHSYLDHSYPGGSTV